jgi:hypothetical protein
MVCTSACSEFGEEQADRGGSSGTSVSHTFACLINPRVDVVGGDVFR